jgi:membrane-associated HD superfamily phosphohydrolase
MRPFMVLQPRTRFLLGCAILVTLTTLLLVTNYSPTFGEDYREGEVLAHDIVAPADISATDVAETERRQTDAREATRPVFNFDSSRAETSVQSLRADWEQLTKQIAPNKTNKSEADLDRLASVIREIGSDYIYDDNDAERLKRDFVLIDPRNPAAGMIVNRMVSLSRARQNLELRILSLPGWTPAQKTALVPALQPLIRPNVVLDQAATAAAREAEAGQVKPVVISLKRNQVVAREGDTVTPNILSQINAIKGVGHRGRSWPKLLGLLVVFFSVYWAAW